MAEVSKTARYIAFITEPCLGKVRKLSTDNDKQEKVVCLPKKNLFYSNVGGTPRAAIVADETQDIVIDPDHSSGDLTVCIWRTSLAPIGSPSNGGSQSREDDDVSSDGFTQSSTPSEGTANGGEEEGDAGTGDGAGDGTMAKPASKEIYLCSMYWDINKTLPKKFVKLIE